uniref:Uncharacterized protein n=1 Tax=Apoglossum ruscifolium TaxID=167976 RepID=A0A4D6WP16_9FLOR|nr:hypothetical protein [Apoglossum ruscifolium]
MNSNLFLFYIYVIIALCFLIPLSYIISLELFNLIVSLIFIYLNYSVVYNNLINSNKLKYYKLIDFYVNRRQLFLCISILEFSLIQGYFDNIFIYSYLAYCYKSLFYFQIAEYYYLKALFYSPSNVVILNNLFELYNMSEQSNKANEIYDRILLLNKNN